MRTGALPLWSANIRRAPPMAARTSTAASIQRSAWCAPWKLPLGLPPMNNDDAFCSVISSLFTGPGDQAPYTADYSNRDNGLIYTANTRKTVGARESSKMDFTHEDSQPTEKLNVILWKDAMGNKPVPALLKAHAKKADKDDDD